MHDISQLDDIQLLTVAEVASVLRLSKMTIYRLIHDGTLDHVRAGAAYRVPVAEVRRFARPAGAGEEPPPAE